ncbi:MAG TPA: 30S ribosome-binding factor RbfA [Candidatus Dormibacteraeota bacterium]|nr:30S ribosome-binding factor RbfA [Candidatus Dormibacteraeota bacterium]
MSLAGHRHERVAEEILHEVGAMLAGELKDPRLSGIVTVTEVRVSPDLKQARIFVSVLGNEEEQTLAMKGLEAAAGFIRRELFERLQMRRTPELHFSLDRSEEYRERIESLLRQTKQETKRDE